MLNRDDMDKGSNDGTFLSIAHSDFARLATHVDARDLAGKTVLLTGATGFFGAWILALFGWIRQHSSEPFRVIAVSRAPAAFIAKHPWIADADWIHWLAGDIRSFDFPAEKIDYVIHAATDTSAAAGRSPSTLFDAIVRGTEHVLACAKACNASRVLLISSGGAYGGQPTDVSQLLESSRSAPSTMDLGSAYGEGNRVMELLGAIHAAEHDCAVVVARCFAFVGAGLPLDGHFAIGNFIRDALGQDKIVIRGDGKGVRSYLYAADLAIWLIRLLQRGKTREIYNVGSDRDITIADLARKVIGTLAPGKTVVVEGANQVTGAGNRYVPSIDRARAELDLDVWTDLPLAIQHTAIWAPK